MEAEKKYTIILDEQMLTSVHLIVHACLNIGGSNFKLPNSEETITLAEITVDFKREIEKQIGKKI